MEATKFEANHILQVGSGGFWINSYETGNLITSSADGGQIMQFTGLLDKNGKEIYESDIVTDHVGRGTVVYSAEYAAFKVSYGGGRAKWFYDYSLRGERESIEVIGNIYENSDKPE